MQQKEHSGNANILFFDFIFQHLLWLAQWGPVGNSLVFVKDNDIYYKPSVAESAVRITTDGSENIFNGVCDWVYEGKSTFH